MTKKITLSSVQETTNSVVAPIKDFPGYYLDRDEDTVYSVKSGTPKKITVRKTETGNNVTLNNNGKSKVVSIGTLRSKVKTFEDKRPVITANIYSKVAKLDADKIRDIRSSTLPGKALAFMYNVSNATISSIVNNKTWRWVR